MGVRTVCTYTNCHLTLDTVDICTFNQSFVVHRPHQLELLENVSVSHKSWIANGVLNQWKHGEKTVICFNVNFIKFEASCMTTHITHPYVLLLLLGWNWLPSSSCFHEATWWRVVDVARIQSAWPWGGRLQLTRARWSDSIDLAAELPALQEIQSVLKQLATESGVVGDEKSDMIWKTEMGLEMDNQELMRLHHSVDGLQDFVLKCLRCKERVLTCPIV